MRKEVFVEMFLMEKEFSPNILNSGGLGPCVAIGFYNPNEKSGYMLHHPMPYKDNLDNYFNEIKEDYKDTSNLEIYVTGNSPSMSDDINQIDHYNLRELIEESLTDYFYDSKLNYDWTDDYNCITNLILDLEKGHFEVERDYLKSY
ncbi:MAG: hypothetical protein ACOCRX_00130 [Candidatus Woesearchaeota archaeon]